MAWLRSLLGKLGAWREDRRAKYVDHEYTTGRTQASDQYNQRYSGGA
jgi:hypothetical protein